MNITVVLVEMQADYQGRAQKAYLVYYEGRKDPLFVKRVRGLKHDVILPKGYTAELLDCFLVTPQEWERLEREGSAAQESLANLDKSILIHKCSQAGSATHSGFIDIIGDTVQLEQYGLAFVAELCGVSTQTILSWMEGDYLPAYKVKKSIVANIKELLTNNVLNPR